MQLHGRLPKAGTCMYVFVPSFFALGFGAYCSFARVASQEVTSPSSCYGRVGYVIARAAAHDAHQRQCL